MSTVKDVMFRCPHCGKETAAYAEIDPYSVHTGSVNIENVNGRIVIDWDSLDADISFLYKCVECGEIVSYSLEGVQELVQTYEGSKK